jgi:hypothetical protein
LIFEKPKDAVAPFSNQESVIDNQQWYYARDK